MKTGVPVQRSVNFGAGPAMLPDDVLRRIRDELWCLPGQQSSILEINHRGPAFRQIMADAKELLRSFVQIPASHEILFLQGGSRLQFSVAPLNFLTPGKPAAYAVTGHWSRMAAAEAQRFASVDLVFDGATTRFTRVPDPAVLSKSDEWSYVYFASNETIQGVQFRSLPAPGTAPLICDMSSDFLSRTVNIEDYAMIFACAQKNAGVSGLTIAIVDRNRLRPVRADAPSYLDFQSHLQSENLFNTPPTFAVYVLRLMLEWLRDTFGNLESVERANVEKADLIYRAMDRHPGVYRPHAELASRSFTNATFQLAQDSDSALFLDGARNLGMSDLKGHRTVGGIRVSLYNAIPMPAVQALAQYMDDFARGRPAKGGIGSA
jgi:phosphoserine aminotransferase